MDKRGTWVMASSLFRDDITLRSTSKKQSYCAASILNFLVIEVASPICDGTEQTEMGERHRF